MTLHILPELVSGWGTADQRSVVEGKRDSTQAEAQHNPAAPPPPLRGRFPSPSKLWEDSERSQLG